MKWTRWGHRTEEKSRWAADADTPEARAEADVTIESVKANSPALSLLQRRFYAKAASTKGTVLNGVIPYGVTVQLSAALEEKLAPGCFAKSIAPGGDVRCMFNGDVNALLGRQGSCTLRFQDSRESLSFEADAPDTEYGKDVRELLRRGDIDGTDALYLISDYRMDGRVRVVTEATLVAVCFSTFPLFEGAVADGQRAVDNSYRIGFQAGLDSAKAKRSSLDRGSPPPFLDLKKSH